MADLTVETGSGLTTANSYASEDFADDYHEDHIYASTWTAATGGNREKALMWATRMLDTKIDWFGSKKTSAQALRWPRYSVSDLDGYTFSSSEIPVWLANATCELARYLLASDRYAEADTKGFKKMKVGPLSMEMDKYDRNPVLPPSVWDMCKPYGRLSTQAPRRLERV